MQGKLREKNKNKHSLKLELIWVRRIQLKDLLCLHQKAQNLRLTKKVKKVHNKMEVKKMKVEMILVVLIWTMVKKLSLKIQMKLLSSQTNMKLKEILFKPLRRN